MDKFKQVVSEMDRCRKEAKYLESTGENAKVYREKEHLYSREVLKANKAKIAENKRFVGSFQTLFEGVGGNGS